MGVLQEDLRSHVPKGACLACHLKSIRVLDLLLDLKRCATQAKVAHLEVPRSIEQEVAGLQITVHNDGVAIV
jgi:hypothetical protein